MTAPPAVFGIDRAEAPPAPWLRALYDASNLRITGAYIDGPIPSRHQAAEYTTSARTTSRHWMDRVPAASRDGWGIVLFYLGYSSASDGSADRSVRPPAGQPTQARGRAHAQHIKHIVGTQIPGWAGAVVMIDNENSEGLNLDAAAELDLKAYYLAMCEELTRPGPDGAPAMRPGMYLHAPVARPILRERPDLFVWDVQIDVADRGSSTTTQPPFDPAATRIDVTPGVTIRAAVVPPARNDTSPPWSAWPVGRQFRFYTGNLPQRAIGPGGVVHPMSTFDFDCSFVRDATFPAAEPRLAAISGGTDAAAVCGSYVEPVRIGQAAAPQMGLTVATARGVNTVLAASRDTPVEPDAPLVAMPPQLPDTVMSISRQGVVLERRLVRGTWGAWETAGGPPPSMRRLRAIAGVKRADGTVYAFTVSTDHRLYAQRRPRDGTWSEPISMAGPTRLHPFSTIAATLRGADHIEVVFLDSEGRLTNAWWATLMSTWPGDAHGPAEPGTAHLVGGSLAAISPTADTLFVFGLGRDLRVSLTAFQAGRGWVAPQSLGRPQDRVAAHARVAAHVVSPGLVEVAVLSHERRVVVHRLRAGTNGWTPEAPVMLPDIPAGRATAPTAIPGTTPRAEVPANGWTPNPFADLALGRTAAGRSFVVLSALAPSAPRTAAVGCYLDGPAQWWLLP